MPTQLGTGHIHGLSTTTLSCSLSGYVSPNLASLKVSHTADRIAVKSLLGRTTGLIFEDDQIECTFEVLPEGTTVANAKLSAGIPAAGSAFGITGCHIVACGGFTDAINTGGGNTQPWIYEGGGGINGVSDEKWTATLPMKRYLYITSGTAIT